MTLLTKTPAPVLKDDPTPAIPDSQMNGDVNMDNKIAIIDALLVAQYYVGRDTGIQGDCCSPGIAVP